MPDERSGFLAVVFSFLTGAALGAGLALIFAPQSGEETRKKIKDTTDKVTDDVKKNYEKLTQETQKAVETLKTTSEKAVGQIKTFIEGAKESIKKEESKKSAIKTPTKKKAPTT